MKGRLGLETARVPQKDRHGLLWLERGHLKVESGSLLFEAAGSPQMPPGSYQIPFQTVSNVLLGPGTSITHDALRILARHQTGLIVTGVHGVRFYASMPFGVSDAKLSREQVRLWSNEKTRMKLARKMFELRFGECSEKYRDIEALRGLEGARMRASYKLIAQQNGLEWNRRKTHRGNLDEGDAPNLALNHSATAFKAAASIAVACTGTIPSLGFIHERTSIAFVLDIADLFRTSHVVPIAFKVAKKCIVNYSLESLEGETRRMAGKVLYDEKIISKMIDHIKDFFDC